jgi:hypothetical protein
MVAEAGERRQAHRQFSLTTYEIGPDRRLAEERIELVWVARGETPAGVPRAPCAAHRPSGITG